MRNYFRVFVAWLANILAMFSASHGLERDDYDTYQKRKLARKLRMREVQRKAFKGE